MRMYWDYQVDMQNILYKWSYNADIFHCVLHTDNVHTKLHNFFWPQLHDAYFLLNQIVDLITYHRHKMVKSLLTILVKIHTQLLETPKGSAYMMGHGLVKTLHAKRQVSLQKN